ncbi:hypothetical protein [Streptosporangium sp. NPDC001681]|uniref:hypothetical protein n=1 Tax=Streptosporangium sp. NPDC001681 TaxID=3154395 RepID=UPI003334407E
MTATLITSDTVPLPADMAFDAFTWGATTTYTLDAIAWSATSYVMNVTGTPATAEDWNSTLQTVNDRIRRDARDVAADYVDEDGGTYDDLDYRQSSLVIATAILAASEIIANR